MGTTLEGILVAKPSGKRLIYDLDKIREKAESLLSRIPQTFPEYTEHGISHSKRVIESLNRNLSDSVKESLNENEIYFLLASAYLHDVGMIDFAVRLVEQTPKGIEKQSIQNSIRDAHHLRSEEFIVKNYKDLAISDAHQARIIGRLCRGHRKEDLYDRSLFEPDRIYKDSSINMPFLAALLRIGDELDLTFERAPIIVFEHLRLESKVSLDEWRKHLSISGVAPHPEDPLLIKCSATCSNPEIHRLLKKLETKINEEMDNLPTHVHQHRAVTKDLPRKFVLSIEPQGYKTYDFKFSLQQNEITKLLMGERLYKRKEESLRELLKNSVDACRARKELAVKQEFDYSPKIIFELSADQSRIIVRDNGIGMNEDTVERYFTKIGKSFYGSPEFLEDFNFTPVSELGIGFLSCFMIATKIVIETKTDASRPLLLEIDNVSDYFIVRDGTANQTGSSITLYLKKDQNINLAKEISYYARHVEFPIEIRLADHNILEVKDHGFSFNVENIFDLLKAYGGSAREFYIYDFHNVEIHDNIVEGIIGTLFRKQKDLGWSPISGYDFQKPYNDKLIEIEKAGLNRIISHEGVFVCHTPILPKWLNPKYIFFDLNAKGRALDFNVARNDVVLNAKCREFMQSLGNILIEDYWQLLSSLAENAERKSMKFQSLVNAFFARYLDLSPTDDLRQEKEFPDKLLEMCKRFFYFKRISSSGIDYLNSNDILKIGKRVVFLERIDEYSEEHIKELMSHCTGFSDDDVYLLYGYPSYYVAPLVFDRYQDRDFLNFLEFQKSDSLEGIFPRKWILATFINYESHRLIEISHWDITILNEKHKFLSLLARNRRVITGDRKIAIKGFFRTLKTGIRWKFAEVIDAQKEILKWFVKAGVIKEEEMKNYLFTQSDFPLHMTK